MARYEEYGRVDVEKALKVMFAMPPYFDYYPIISRKYKDFEFSDELTDSRGWRSSPPSTSSSRSS